jgi:DNA-binding NtrC family response regulator
VSDTIPPTGRVRVLYVDDEEDVRDVFEAVFEGIFDVTTAESGDRALQLLSERPFDVLVSDMRMSPMRGTELLARVYDRHRDVQRILLTAFTSHDDLAAAVNLGHVFACVQKPWEKEHLRLTILRAYDIRRLENENQKLLAELRTANAKLAADVDVATRQSSTRPRLEVYSPRMRQVLEQVGAVATTDANVLLYGETGVGKELIAAHIHEQSPRRKGRFVAQNLAALPAELMTSELFGHVKGAFTGAQQSRRGLFELADGGTLFLDEIGEAPHSLQALLLRALESREFWPVGSSEPRHVDVRIVAATNRDLLADAKAGLFRLDLYYRLAVCPIEIPALRARPEDIRGIGTVLLEAAARRMNRPAPKLTEQAYRALERHPWPGNVRELGNVMERLVIYKPGTEVDDTDLALPDDNSASSRSPSFGPPPSLRPDELSALDRATPSFGAGASGPPSVRSFDIPPAPMSSRSIENETLPSGTISLALPEGGTTFEELERDILAQVLLRADGNQSRAARSLGLSESTFRSRLKRLGLKG